MCVFLLLCRVFNIAVRLGSEVMFYQRLWLFVKQRLLAKYTYRESLLINTRHIALKTITTRSLRPTLAKDIQRSDQTI